MNSKTSPGNTSSGYDPEMSELRNVVRVAEMPSNTLELEILLL